MIEISVWKNCSRRDDNRERSSKDPNLPRGDSSPKSNIPRPPNKDPYPPPDDAFTLVSLGDVGLGREFENLTVRYCFVWPAWLILALPEWDNGYATLLKGERRGEGWKTAVNCHKESGIPLW